MSLPPIRRCLIATGCLIPLFWSSAPTLAQVQNTATFITFSAGNCDTRPVAINDFGTITGYCGVPAKYRYDMGFVRDASGTITQFSAPNAIQTEPAGINAQGSITGTYYVISVLGYPGPPTYAVHGFVRSPQGVITTIDGPSTTETWATGINNAGTITGYYTGPHDVAQGFVRSPDGTFTEFGPPGVPCVVGGCGVFPEGINTAGSIAGYYFNPNNVSHGFVRYPNGTFTPFDLPGSTRTWVTGISADGSTTGYYLDANGVTHDFVRSPWGLLTTFDTAGSCPSGCFSYALSINAAGTVTGYYQNGNDRRSFIRSRSGVLTTFEVCCSYATGINGPGVITGWYEGPQSGGFLRVPAASQ
jgi:hypothetical protein